MYGSQLAGLSGSLSVVGRSCKESKEGLSSVIGVEIRTRYTPQILSHFGVSLDDWDQYNNEYLKRFLCTVAKESR